MLQRRSVLKAALAAGSAIAAPTVFGQKPPLRIGALNPYSGPMALMGTEVTRGYELAVDLINVKGGLFSNRRLEIIRGDVTTPQQGIAAVERLATSEHVDIFVGTYISAIALTASDAALRYNKLYWETNALSEELTDRNLPNFIRSGPDASAFAISSATVVRDLIAPALKIELNSLKVWIESESSIYGTSIAKVQKQNLESSHAKIVGTGEHAANSIDLSDTVLRIQKADPDLLIQTGYVSDSNLLLRTLRTQGVKPKAILLVGTGDTPETLQALGANYLEGIVVVGYPRFDIAEAYGPGHGAYFEAYKNKYKSDPIAPQGLTSYSGILMLADVLRLAGNIDVDKVRDAAAKIDKPVHSYPAGYGLRFNKNFQNTRTALTASQWQSGKIVTVYPPAAVAGEVALAPLNRS